jgi:sugar/nucleoside kinase (ribokinase family)
MTINRPMVTIIGDAFVDLIVTVPEVVIGGTFHRKIVSRTGGVANVAVMIAKLGEKAKFIGKIGNDPFGRYFTDSLLSDGVEVHSLTDKKENTGLCISLAYPGGERVLIADRRANDSLSKIDLEGYTEEIINSTYVYLSGYSLLKPATSSCILYAMECCHNRCVVVFNPGAPNLVSDEFKTVIKKYVNILILNWDEAVQITGESNEEKVVFELSKLNELSVVTLGKKGCLIVSENISERIPTVGDIFAKDTTGAGDAFSAGFLVGKMRGLNLIDCAKLANETAKSLIIQRTKELE